MPSTALLSEPDAPSPPTYVLGPASWTQPPPERCRSLVAPKEPAHALDPPSWTQLPPQRRRRLVAVLGDLVLRVRGEEARDEPSREGEVDGYGAP